MGVFGNELKASGFASPAQGYEGSTFDFNKILVKNPPATYIIRKEGGDMADFGILDGALLIVDRSLKPKNGSIVVIAYEGVFLCRQIKLKNEYAEFSKAGGTIRVPHSDYEIFGVVTAAINEV
ncbi:MAG: hypothetical protein LBG72_09005 [Spirochaetaceae bacterium]|nr:hypothetical protein [Spirochaetaceae bacterium]